MSQRTQSILFFLSGLLFALTFFLPLAEYVGETNILQFNVYGVESILPDGGVPFGKMFALPVLILTVTIVLISIYLALGLFRAVKMNQFVKLHRLARVDIILTVAWIALVFAWYIIAVGKPIAAVPSYRIGAFLPLAALVLLVIAASGLGRDIKKVRSMDRLR